MERKSFNGTIENNGRIFRAKCQYLKVKENGQKVRFFDFERKVKFDALDLIHLEYSRIM